MHAVAPVVGPHAPPTPELPPVAVHVERVLVTPPSAALPDDLARAQATLLQAALRQADDLELALANERQVRERLLAENELLRNALAGLHAEALARQHAVDPPEVTGPQALVPVQREQSPQVQEPAEQPGEQPRPGRRRSGREAGPA